jgi:hypothetical protein
VARLILQHFCAESIAKKFVQPVLSFMDKKALVYVVDHRSFAPCHFVVSNIRSLVRCYFCCSKRILNTYLGPENRTNKVSLLEVSLGWI